MANPTNAPTGSRHAASGWVLFAVCAGDRCCICNTCHRWLLHALVVTIWS